MGQPTLGYEIANSENEACSLALDLNRMYRLQSFEQMVSLPEQMGEGYWQRIQISPMIELVLCDVRFRQEVTLSSREMGSNMNLGFCLGDDIKWSMKGRKSDFGLGSGEVSAYGNLSSNYQCQYDAGRHFQGLTLKMNHMEANSGLLHLPLNRLTTLLSGNAGQFYNTPVTPGLNRIVKEIFHCPYQGDVKHIYLSGKVLELIAVYMNESVQENDIRPAYAGLSRTDIASLYQAKEIVDADLICPPGLSELAKLVCLNEFKLKKGFKQLFGKPVYAYVIDQRLETAFRLLETGLFKITEAAYAAGFGKVAHFSEQFRRKHGVNPSEYFRHPRR
jgi:AraC-like DNA-binding protein